MIDRTRLQAAAPVWIASLALAVAIGLATSSLLGVGLFLLLPSVAAALLQRRR